MAADDSRRELPLEARILNDLRESSYLVWLRDRMIDGGKQLSRGSPPPELRAGRKVALSFPQPPFCCNQVTPCGVSKA